MKKEYLNICDMKRKSKDAAAWVVLYGGMAAVENAAGMVISVVNPDMSKKLLFFWKQKTEPMKRAAWMEYRNSRSICNMVNELMNQIV